MTAEELYKKEYGNLETIPKESVIRLLKHFAIAIKQEKKIAASESWDVAILKTTHTSSDNAWMEFFDKEKEEYLKKYDQ